MGAFQERFNKAPPRISTLREFSFGKDALMFLVVLKTDRGVEKKTREETCAVVAAWIEQSPIKSRRKRVAELGIPRTTMRDHMKKNLKVRPYRPLYT
ncbi:hypothetical protein C0J52_23422 [Blattella germanica]|nr:hypothetical protein C0J52_23422 [Blattella germanica]